MDKEILRHFLEGYSTAAQTEEKEALIKTFASLVEKEAIQKSHFSLFHEAVKSPFDYDTFGLKFLKALIDKKRSILLGKENLKTIESRLKAQENVILFANHQVEPDPQIIRIMLEEEFPLLSKKMIFVAGDRVVRDPIAIPLSLGCNLLCIYSKKYIDSPPDEKEQKLLHNKKTMHEMERLLKKGGQIIYVAPSGGRDRKTADGTLLPAPFDPGSIEMFYLIAKKAGVKTHFHTLALHTYDLLPPPMGINIEIGEERIPTYSPVQLYFGDSFDLEKNDHPDKKERRRLKAEALHKIVLDHYRELI